MVISDKLISEDKIHSRLKELADTLDNDYKGKRPVMLGTLKGAFIVLADLVRLMKTPVDIEFIRCRSYDGTRQGSVRTELLLSDSVENRHVVIVEDIVDTGSSIKALKERLKEENPASIKVFSLLYKPAKQAAAPDYTGFEIKDEFVVGYGLDCGGSFRNLPDIWTIKDKPRK